MKQFAEAHKTVLITGGTGYIGSHISHLLAHEDYHVIVLDNRTHTSAHMPWATVIHGDYGDAQTLENIFATYAIDAIIHCAAFIEVGQSVRDPLAFYQNNVANTITLLTCMRIAQINKIIFASSCAVYGIPHQLPLREDHPHASISPYGQTKAMIEQMLRDADQAYGIRSVCLRFFNAAGAYPEMQLGERHEPETHLIPLLLRAAQNQTPFSIFGTNHNTPDGTCVRDFVHVRDIAQAHLLALHYLTAGNASDAFNLGTGHGYSVKQVIAAVEKICQRTIPVMHQSARAGDPAILVADPAKARTILGWQPAFSEIERMVDDAFCFETRCSPTSTSSVRTEINKTQ